MIYWKRGIYFGKTTEKGITFLREIDINVKTISKFYFYLLCFIKYIMMIILSVPAIVGLLIIIICKLIIYIINIPVNMYIKYFLN